MGYYISNQMTLSTKNITDCINFDNVIIRLLDKLHFSKQIELANYFGITKQDFLKRKNRGTLLSLIVICAIDNNIDLNWLLTGYDLKIGNLDYAQVLKKFSDIETRLTELEEINSESLQHKKGATA